MVPTLKRAHFSMVSSEAMSVPSNIMKCISISHALHKTRRQGGRAPLILSVEPQFNDDPEAVVGRCESQFLRRKQIGEGPNEPPPK